MKEKKKDYKSCEKVIDAILDDDVVELRKIFHNNEFSSDDIIFIRYRKYSNGMTYLGLAIKYFKASQSINGIYKLDVIKFLLEKVKDINKKDQAGNTALIILFKRYDMDNCHRMSIMELLLNAGADVNIRDYKRRNVLHYATNTMEVNNSIDSSYGLKIMKSLLEKGVNVNEKDIENETAITILSKRYDIDNCYFIIYLMRLFLKAGADINIKGLKGRTVLHNYSLDTHGMSSVDLCSRMIIFCLKNGADATLIDDEKLLPINYLYLPPELFSDHSILVIILCIASYRAILNFDWSNLQKYYSCKPDAQLIFSIYRDKIEYFMGRVKKIFSDCLDEENSENINHIFSLIIGCDPRNMEPVNIERVIEIEEKELLEAFLKIDINLGELDREFPVEKYDFIDIILNILDIKASKLLKSYKLKLWIGALTGLIQEKSGETITIDCSLGDESYVSGDDVYNLCLVSKNINLSANANISDYENKFIHNTNLFRKKIGKYKEKNMFFSNSNSKLNSGKVIEKTKMIGVSLLLLLCTAVVATFITPLYNNHSNSEEITALLIVGIMPFTILTLIIIPLNYYFYYVKNLNELVEFPCVQEVDCVPICCL